MASLSICENRFSKITLSLQFLANRTWIPYMNTERHAHAHLQTVKEEQLFILPT